MVTDIFLVVADAILSKVSGGTPDSVPLGSIGPHPGFKFGKISQDCLDRILWFFTLKDRVVEVVLLLPANKYDPLPVLQDSKITGVQYVRF